MLRKEAKKRRRKGEGEATPNFCDASTHSLNGNNRLKANEGGFIQINTNMVLVVFDFFTACRVRERTSCTHYVQIIYYPNCCPIPYICLLMSRKSTYVFWYIFMCVFGLNWRNFLVLSCQVHIMRVRKLYLKTNALLHLSEVDTECPMMFVSVFCMQYIIIIRSIYWFEPITQIAIWNNSQKTWLNHLKFSFRHYIIHKW